jgi:hypothetical protein
LIQIKPSGAKAASMRPMSKSFFSKHVTMSILPGVSRNFFPEPLTRTSLMAAPPPVAQG